MPTDTTLSERVSLIDPQGWTSMSAVDVDTRDLLLTRLRTSDPTGSDRVTRPARRPNRRGTAVIGGLFAVSAAAAVGVLVVSGSTTAHQADYALSGPISLASWTKTPTRATVSDADTATCASALYGSDVDPSGLTVSGAENRGDFTAFQLLGSATPGYCVLLGSTIVVAEQILPTSSAPPAAGEAEIDMMGIAVNSFDGPDAAANTAKAGNIGLAEGHVGPDVTTVTVHLSNGTDVLATVADGAWSAWWPGELETPVAGSADSGVGVPTATFTTSGGGTGTVTPDENQSDFPIGIETGASRIFELHEHYGK
ncbi:MAG: hypothetical protein JWQ64_559 [Subtercola sp.]|nr:hypothetical protein [Subtercola sp.]